MPNWCSNSMVVYGSPAEVKDFYNRVVNAKKKAEIEKIWDLYAIYDSFNYVEKYIMEDGDSCGYVRGTIEYIGEVVTDSEDKAHFEIEYESAWRSMFEGFDWLFERHYKTLKEVTIAEECGCGIYINTDTKGEYFKERYHMYIEDNDDFYLCSDSELINTFNKYVDEKNQVSSVQECFDYLKENDYEFEINGEPRSVSLDEYTAF